MTYKGTAETRGYNTLNQPTSLVAGSGETVTYTYDSLHRLLTANGSGWGEQYGLDPFGNLTSKTVTSGSGPSLSVSVNANNQIQGVSGLSYDANGNQNVGTYDAENRLATAAGLQYAYDAQNRRIWSWNGTPDGLGNPTGYTVNLYSPTGQKLGAYVIAPFDQNNMGNLGVTLASSDQYFGGRRLAVLDQLGSVGTYYPWGENKGTTNPQNTWSFATYWQDSTTSLDYANQRYYSNAYGRFTTPDPYTANTRSAGDQNDPQSWNKYAYTRGDPINRHDPGGLLDCAADPDDGECHGFVSTNCDPSQATCTFPCFGVDGSPSPNPYCQFGGLLFAATQSDQGPECSIELWQRPTPTLHGPAWHTYISGSETFGSGLTITFDFEGGPQPTYAAVGGKLTGTIAPPGLGLSGFGPADTTGPGFPSNFEVGDAYTAANSCADFRLLFSLVNSYNGGPRVTYDFSAVLGYNSNSFTFTLLNQLGLLSYFGVPGGPEPGGGFLVIPGWGKSVPGL
jgi:RHS repeat-associated protein